MTEEIKIGVSGTAVYKAVRNYLSNSPELKATIDAHVKRLADAGVLEEIARAKVAEQLKSYYATKELFQKAAKDVITAEIKSQIETITREALKKALEGSIIVMPKP